MTKSIKASIRMITMQKIMKTGKRTGKLVGVAALAAGLLAGTALGQTTHTMTNGTQVSSDSWNNTNNWNTGIIPGGAGGDPADSAVVNAGLLARVNLSAPTYSGGLDLSGANMTIESVSGAQNAYGTGTITMDGSTLIMQCGFNLSLPPINLVGDGIVDNTSNAADDDDRNFSGIISGAGQLTCKPRNKQYYDFAVSNSFTGGLVFETRDRSAARFKAAGSAGAGDVTVVRRSDGRYVGLILQASDVFADTATLTLDGKPYANQNWPNSNFGPAYIDLGSYSNTVNSLVVNGTVYPADVYDTTKSWIAGSSGTLTVLTPSDTTAPVFGSFTDDASGGPISETTDVIDYIISFQEDFVMDPGTIDASDFGNAGTASVTIGTIFELSGTNFSVRVVLDSSGTVQLKINAGADIRDMAGNPLDTSSAILDDTIITVTPFVPPPDQARLTPRVDGFTAFESQSNPVSGTFDASGSDKLVVVVTGEQGNPGSLAGNCTGITYDGVALTQAVDRNPIGSAPDPAADWDQTFNDIWYLDDPGSVHVAGAIVATVNSRGNVTAFGLSDTAPGVGGTGISHQERKSVKVGAVSEKSIVIASHGMGGNGNTADTQNVNAVAPLIEATAQNHRSWDGHVTGHMTVESQGVVIPTFVGGNLIGSHTIAAEFPGALIGGTLIMLK